MKAQKVVPFSEIVQLPKQLVGYILAICDRNHHQVQCMIINGFKPSTVAFSKTEGK